jgi:hypothetical protein
MGYELSVGAGVGVFGERILVVPLTSILTLTIAFYLLSTCLF